ncbi:DNA repair protein rad51 homolog a [Phtheirospermum japonicum]|uniref:DNA repair protein rad51 homolog a n=1 Tax=Phtheirospermum japonicum TaxID=374723 RepID=A0A830BT86_9LAMI|nr:DNA repair protein rad51 homolog a [Phtheirospermum japonicum]
MPWVSVLEMFVENRIIGSLVIDHYQKLLPTPETVVLGKRGRAIELSKEYKLNYTPEIVESCLANEVEPSNCLKTTEPSNYLSSIAPHVPLVGSLAGSIACVSCYPIELASTRMEPPAKLYSLLSFIFQQESDSGADCGCLVQERRRPRAKEMWWRICGKGETTK